MIALFRRIDEFVATAPVSLVVALSVGLGVLVGLALGVGFGFLLIALAGR